MSCGQHSSSPTRDNGDLKRLVSVLRGLWFAKLIVPIFTTHTPQVEQWWALSGFDAQHFLHHRPGLRISSSSSSSLPPPMSASANPIFPSSSLLVDSSRDLWALTVPGSLATQTVRDVRVRSNNELMSATWVVNHRVCWRIRWLWYMRTRSMDGWGG